DMGLGSARSVSLALARELRDDCHVKLARSLDPIEARNSAVLAARAEHAKQMTFRQCTEDYLTVNASKWRNAKHRKQWLATLTRYAYPVFGNLSVAAMDSGLVFKALKPLVADKPVRAACVGALRQSWTLLVRPAAATATTLPTRLSSAICCHCARRRL